MIEVKGSNGQVVCFDGQFVTITRKGFIAREKRLPSVRSRQSSGSPRLGMEWLHPVHGTRRQQAGYARRQRREQRDVHQETDA